jgi:2-keto-4-pentenoate hydratase/2-oxohepta-3-ene-1,7-dioic acid hydratase in catechol pathway
MRQLYRLLHEYHAYFAIRAGDQFQLLRGDPGVGANELSPRTVPVASAILLPPVTPSKIVAVGLNYHQHAAEMKMAPTEEPVIFLKPLTSLSAPGAPIELPPSSRQVDYEGELAVVIGRSGRHIPETHAQEWIQGYTLANDVTARDLQKKDGQWTRAKGFDGFCPIGPCVAMDLDASRLEIRTLVNGQVRQRGAVSDFIFSIPRLVAFISEVMTLLPGDVILTGTPAGIGPLQPGDKVKIECDQIGALENTVVAGK